MEVENRGSRRIRSRMSIQVNSTERNGTRTRNRPSDEILLKSGPGTRRVTLVADTRKRKRPVIQGKSNRTWASIPGRTSPFAFGIRTLTLNVRLEASTFGVAYITVPET